MKLLIVIFNFTVYTVQIISLFFTFFIYINHKNKTFKYYLMTMFFVIMDSSFELIRIYFEVFSRISHLFNGIKFFILAFEFFFGFLLLINFMEVKPKSIYNIFLIIISICPLIYSIFEFLIINHPYLEAFYSRFRIISQILSLLFIALIIIINYKNITDHLKKRIRYFAIIITAITGILYIIDSSIYFKGLFYSFIPVLLWNIINIYFLWKLYFSKKSKLETLENFVKRYKITVKEKEIILLIKEGLLNKEIASKLGSTEGTVKIHIYNIFRKTGINTRIDLLNLIDH